ncbi:hypothetical protein GSI_11562 [Ganoderma sinense ZZ0214-1]|uniref:Fe2OG dioxygenase domain-containing protein n=1 Tax=Ganoderma sinense ZZ0214-1 TaxID=1077348 RepID=A0A2G8RWB9_9APHY|nr:hypothetical protein GSI_11562 [Ganoderma sinense ZZ0214-1]
MSAASLDAYLVPGTSTTYYIPEFITEDEEEYLIRKKHLSLGGSGYKIADIIGRIRALGVFKDSAHGEPNHIIMNEYAPGQGIMPHEDGPAYHPVVATLSLGSHAVFNYYRYKPDTDASPLPGVQISAPNEPISSTGRPIDPTPVLAVLLEPRSLVITTSALYVSHLHGIDGLLEDKFEEDGRPPQERIANYDLLRGAAERAAIANGSILERGLRYSLTCRDVEKVAAMGGALFKRLRGTV